MDNVVFIFNTNLSFVASPLGLKGITRSRGLAKSPCELDLQSLVGSWRQVMGSLLRWSLLQPSQSMRAFGESKWFLHSQFLDPSNLVARNSDCFAGVTKIIDHFLSFLNDCFSTFSPTNDCCLRIWMVNDHFLVFINLNPFLQT